MCLSDYEKYGCGDVALLEAFLILGKTRLNSCVFFKHVAVSTHILHLGLLRNVTRR